MFANNRTESEISRTKWEMTSIPKIAAFPNGFMSSRPGGSQLPK